MSSGEKSGTCPSKAYVQDELVRCQREDGHPGVHLGPVHLSEGADQPGTELVQWKDGDAATDADEAQELPVWYSVLPIGQEVIVGYRDDRERLVGKLAGAVLDDHEQLSAVMVEYPASPRSLQRRRAIIPFDNVAVLSWELAR